MARYNCPIVLLAAVFTFMAMISAREVTQTAKGGAVTRAPFGKLKDGSAVEIFTLTNAKGVEVRAITYGGIIQSWKVPDKAGTLEDSAMADLSPGDFRAYRRDLLNVRADLFC